MIRITWVIRSFLVGVVSFQPCCLDNNRRRRRCNCHCNKHNEGERFGEKHLVGNLWLSWVYYLILYRIRFYEKKTIVEKCYLIDDGRIAKLTVAATFAKNICVNGGTPSTAEVDSKVLVESTSSCHVMFVVFSRYDVDLVRGIACFWKISIRFLIRWGESGAGMFWELLGIIVLKLSSRIVELCRSARSEWSLSTESRIY